MSDRHPVNIRHRTDASFGERAADLVASTMGSWRFLGFQTAIIAIWISYNGYVAATVLHGGAFDALPFILLNLLFSTQAAYAAPILQLSGNRQSQKDRLTLEQTYDDTQTLLREIKINTEATLRVEQRLADKESPRDRYRI